jgi:hypothetical protein
MRTEKFYDGVRVVYLKGDAVKALLIDGNYTELDKEIADQIHIGYKSKFYVHRDGSILYAHELKVPVAVMFESLEIADQFFQGNLTDYKKDVFSSFIYGEHYYNYIDEILEKTNKILGTDFTYENISVKKFQTWQRHIEEFTESNLRLFPEIFSGLVVIAGILILRKKPLAVWETHFSQSPYRTCYVPYLREGDTIYNICYAVTVAFNDGLFYRNRLTLIKHVQHEIRNPSNRIYLDGIVAIK